MIACVVALVALCGTAQILAAPPCYNPLNPSYETICYTTVQQEGKYSVRDYGVGVQATLATSFSTTFNFTQGSYAAAANVFDYFLYDNAEVRKLPLTAPLIFRPTPAQTWAASFALPLSAIPSPNEAPGPAIGANLLLQPFLQRRIASYTFYTSELATDDDYFSACALLVAYLNSHGLSPTPGDWQLAWVTYTPLNIVGDRANECWIEVGPAPAPPARTSPPCYTPFNPNFETVCYSVVATAQGGNITIRNLGATVNASIAIGYSTSGNFSNGSTAAATNIFSYFQYDNSEFVKIPTTVPLIYRPTPAGTWSASMILPASRFPSPSAVPGPVAGLDLEVQPFGQHKIAAFTFYTIYEATEDAYRGACQQLSAYLSSQGLIPKGGNWQQAWVTYSTRQIIGNRINECWIEIS